MKINRKSLLTQLEMALPGLSPREIIEQSACFIFQKGILMTYNDEIACSLQCNLKIEGAIPAEPLISILRKMKEKKIEVEMGEGELLIKGKQKRIGIRMEEEILLPIDTVERPKEWRKLPKDFADAISIVQECAGKDETQFSLTCINIHPKWIEACDNSQVSRYNIKIGVEQSTIVRKESLKYIVSLDMIEFSETKTWIHFRNSDGMTLSCRRYIEDYPDLTKLLDVEGSRIHLPKRLKEATERAEVFSTENLEDNQVTVKLMSNKIKITGRGASGWFSEIKKAKYSGQTIIFTISPKLLIELVQRRCECEVTPKRLKVEGDKFVYVACLGMVKEKKSRADTDD